jgi:hypothetical protein
MKQKLKKRNAKKQRSKDMKCRKNNKLQKLEEPQLKVKKG